MINTIGISVVLLVVIAVLAVVAYAFFKLSPFASHVDQYRDPENHRRLFDSPHLETRDEFERREH